MRLQVLENSIFVRLPCAAHEKPFYFRTEHTSYLRSLKNKTLKRKHTKIIYEDFWSVWKCELFVWAHLSGLDHVLTFQNSCNVAPFTGGFSLPKYRKLCCIPCPMVCTCPTYHFERAVLCIYDTEKAGLEATNIQTDSHHISKDFCWLWPLSAVPPWECPAYGDVSEIAVVIQEAVHFITQLVTGDLRHCCSKPKDLMNSCPLMSFFDSCGFSLNRMDPKTETSDNMF